MLSSVRFGAPQPAVAPPRRSVQGHNQPADQVSLSQPEPRRPSFLQRNALALGFMALIGLGMGMHAVGVAIHDNHPITANAASVTVERELAGGEQCARNSGRAGKDATELARVERLGRQLRPYQTRTEMSYSVQLQDTGIQNAHACSNGALFFEQSLSRRLDDQELLFVGAHELGHVELRHSATKLSYLDQAGWVVHVPIMNQPFVRDFHALSQSTERQADCFGVGVLRAEGIPVEKAESALRKTIGDVPQHGTHPPLEERLEALRRC